MSSFFVGPETINATVTLLLMADGPRSLSELNKLGKSLWMLNALALEQRYESEKAEAYLDAINEYRFEHTKDESFEAILKATNCFLYQCSEGDVPKLAVFKKLKAISEQYDEHPNPVGRDRALGSA